MKRLGKLEERYRKQSAYWVSDLVVDALEPSVRVSLLAEPDTVQVDCMIHFTGVRDIRVEWHGESDEGKANYLSTLMGIDDYLVTDGTKYVVATDTVEVIFFSSIEPSVTRDG